MSTQDAETPAVRIVAEARAHDRPAPPRTRLARWGGWLLALSPLSFVLVTLNTISFAMTLGETTFADITRQQMDELGTAWVLVSVLFPLAVIVGTIGMMLVAISIVRSRLRGAAWAWASIVAGALVIVGFVPYAPLRIAAMRFTEPALGENGLYTAWDLPHTIAFALAPVALTLLCIALYVAVIRRTAAVIIGALGLVLAVCLAVQLPIPPFSVAFLWCALGIAWLRAPRRESGARQ